MAAKRFKNPDHRHHPFVEPHRGGMVARLNWLRAGVLGANDGIVSISGLVLGVAAATDSTPVILTAGVAGIVSGAISMAAGEYVSVSSSRDSERALIRKEAYELKHFPDNELNELAGLYRKKGLTAPTARTVARELTAGDVTRAHLDIELNIDPDELTNPWHAAFASATAFLAGAVIPLLAIILPPLAVRIPVAFVAIVTALVITGTVSGRIGGAHIGRAIVRVVAGGILAMSVTYAVGRFFGVRGL